MGDQMPDLTIVLFGNTSAVRFGDQNILLGQEPAPLEKDDFSRTAPKPRMVSGRNISVINILGLQEDELYLDTLDKITGQLVKENEIHAFIFILCQLTDADKLGLEWLQSRFGEGVLPYVMILFTYEREEDCDTIIDDLKNNSVLEELLKKCGDRYHTCSKSMNNQSEMRTLLEKIDHLVSENNQHCYTAEMYHTGLKLNRNMPDNEIQKKVVYCTMEEKDLTEIAALGRPFQLGMLYDLGKDAVIPDIQLWDFDLQTQKHVSPCENITFHIISSDSIDDKASALQLDGPLKLSLLTGLVNVNGAAKYFSDTTKSPNQRRLTVKCHATTKHEQLSIHVNQLLAKQKVSHPDMLKEGGATHVVTAVLYGADAFFVLDREVTSGENKDHVEKEVKCTKEMLETHAGVHPGSTLNMTISETEAVAKFRCAYHGDLKLSKNPSTFRDVLDVCSTIPNILGPSHENVVPLRVWLYPLEKINASVETTNRELSSSLTSDILHVVESLNKVEMKCNEIIDNEVSKTFPAMSNNFLELKDHCKNYKEHFLKKLMYLLPLVRGGAKDENAIADILRSQEESPFGSHVLKEWIEQKEKEYLAVKAFVEQLAKIGVGVDNNLEELLADISIDHVVCFTFTSLEQPEPFLAQMLNYLNQTESFNTCIGTSWLNPAIRQQIRENLKLVKSMKSSLNNDDTKFIVSSKYDEKHPGACIMVYENGSDEAAYFTPPSQDSVVLHVGSPSSDSIKVQLEPACTSTVERKIEYKMQNEGEWKTQTMKLSEHCVTLTGLKPNAVFEVKCTAFGKLRFSVSSDITTFHTNKAAGPPTELKTQVVKSSLVKISWNCPKFQHACSVNAYIIEFKEKDVHEWQKIKTSGETYSFDLVQLKPNTHYSVRISTDCGVAGISDPSEELLIATKKSLLAHIIENKSHAAESNSEPALHNLKLISESRNHFSKFTFGNEPSMKQNKTIMLLGATGSGKTTLINGMINYILGVEWEDTCRFRLINEVTNKSQAESQTSEVTAYQVHHTEGFNIPYSLTIIDTPGFGDTRGIKQDKAIIDKIRDFFSHPNGILAIDAVCFVVQSSLARLTHTQKYIFDSILSLFGKDIENNIAVLITFADGQTPPVLEAIKSANIPCAKSSDGSILHVKFNNSALFAPNIKSDGDNFDEMFWRMGKGSMENFFKHIDTMPTQSLQLTKKVLLERNRLEVTVQNLQPLIKIGLGKLDEINSTRKALEEHQDTENANKDFEYETEVTKPVMIDIPKRKYVTNCYDCQFTCHYPCGIPNDANKASCSAMKDGKCTQCPDKCPWNKHFNTPYRWDIQTVKEKRTYAELKKKYEDAIGKKMDANKIGKQLVEEYQQVQMKVLDMVKKLSECLKHLKTIALRPDPLATPDYIDLLIQAEEQEGSPGFKQRIAELQGVRQQAEILHKVSQNIDLSKEEKSTYSLMEKAERVVKGIFNNVSDWFK